MASHIEFLQVFALATSAGLSGMIAAFSIAGIPMITLAPSSTALLQYQRLFNIGARTAPPLMLASTISYSYLAYASRNSTPDFSILGIPTKMALYANAAALILSTIPFAALVMHPSVNDRLRELAGMVEREGKISVKEGELEGLWKKWRALNGLRAGIVGLGAVLGAVATIVLN